MSLEKSHGAPLAEAWKRLNADDFSGALNVVAAAFERVGKWTSGTQRLPIGWPGADRLIAAVAERVRGSMPESRVCKGRGDCDAVVIARWNPTGGHAAVAADLLNASCAPNKRAFVVRAGPGERSPEPIARRLGLSPGDVELCPEGAGMTPWEWLPQRLAAFGGTRLFVFHETNGPELLVAVLASPAARVFVVHHVDAKPCSGLHLPGVTVIELTPFGWHYSRTRLGIDPVYLPLSSNPPPGERPAFLETGELRTATCGRTQKFDLRYPFRYSEIVAERLRRFGGRHLHIGQLSSQRLAAIGGALDRLGVARERLEHLPSVSRLPAELWAQRIDLYMGSFPFGGARTLVDVMASATPAILHLPSVHTRFGTSSLACEGSAFWSTPEELWRILDAVDAGWLAERARLARAHFERFHRPALLAAALARPDCTGLQPLPQGPHDRLPEPQDILCHLLADVAELRHREVAIRERLASLEARVKARAAETSRPWWRRWLGRRRA